MMRLQPRQRAQHARNEWLQPSLLRHASRAERCVRAATSTLEHANPAGSHAATLAESPPASPTTAAQAARSQPAPPPPPSQPQLDQQQRHAQQGTRPLVPQVDLVQLAQALLADPSDDPLRRTTVLGQALIEDGGPPRLFKPRVERPAGALPSSSLPLMFYLPGIDGTGLAAFRQFPSLSGAFDLHCLVIPPDDRRDFEALVELVAGLVREQVAADPIPRPVYLLGESFGGTLCLALAAVLGGDLVDRLVLVNPATSFSDSVWPAAGPLLTALPSEAYRLLPLVLSPVLGNPLAMAAASVDAAAPPLRQASDLAYALVDMLPQLAALRLVLPAETLAWRLQLLAQGARWVQARLAQVRQRVLVIAGDRDLLIPSEAEAKRLGRALPRCAVRMLPGRSHALLQEGGVDLVTLLQEEGFYVDRLTLSNGAPPARGAHGGAAFGTPAPVQLPTQRELDRDTQGVAQTIRRLCSPVFYSTDAQGRIQQGLDGIPAGRPLLLVGPHGLFATDMYCMVEEFMREKGVLLRGLAHPVIFGATTPPGGDITSTAPAIGGAGGAGFGGTGANFLGNFLSTYGAVPVSGASMYELLQNGEAVLLYPGGAREAFKRRGERYQLFWPEKSEFVRMAARFGATIVPFAAIGADEGATQLLDGADLASLPFIGDRLRASQAAMPAARRGVNAVMEDTASFAQPLIAPNLPVRHYYLFGAPVPTTPELARDRVACQVLYETVKGDVEDGLGYLLRMRERDPFRDLLPRLAYEASWGWRRQAPSFKP